MLILTFLTFYYRDIIYGPRPEPETVVVQVTHSTSIPNSSCRGAVTLYFVVKQLCSVVDEIP